MMYLDDQATTAAEAAAEAAADAAYHYAYDSAYFNWEDDDAAEELLMLPTTQLTTLPTTLLTALANGKRNAMPQCMSSS
jgi:hypothetical protein